MKTHIEHGPVGGRTHTRIDDNRPAIHDMKQRAKAQADFNSLKVGDDRRTAIISVEWKRFADPDSSDEEFMAAKSLLLQAAREEMHLHHLFNRQQGNEVGFVPDYSFLNGRYPAAVVEEAARGA